MVPWPTVLSTEICPPIPVTMPWQMDRPSPVPTPSGLVVKKGSKMLLRSSGSMPLPLSWTVTTMSVSCWRVVTRTQGSG